MHSLFPGRRNNLKSSQRVVHPGKSVAWRHVECFLIYEKGAQENNKGGEMKTSRQ